MAHPGYFTVQEFCAAYGIGRNTAHMLLQRGLFPYALRVGRRDWRLPVGDAKDAVAWLRMSPIERVRFTEKDGALIEAGTAAALIGLSRGWFSALRKKGCFPKARGVMSDSGKYYHVSDIVDCAKKNGMWYDMELAEKLLNDVRNLGGDRIITLQ